MTLAACSEIVAYIERVLACNRALAGRQRRAMQAFGVPTESDPLLVESENLIDENPLRADRRPIARDTDYAAPPSTLPAWVSHESAAPPIHDDEFHALPSDREILASGVVEVETRPRLPEAEDEERAPSDAVFADVAREIRNVMGGGG